LAAQLVMVATQSYQDLFETRSVLWYRMMHNYLTVVID